MQLPEAARLCPEPGQKRTLLSRLDEAGWADASAHHAPGQPMAAEGAPGGPAEQLVQGWCHKVTDQPCTCDTTAACRQTALYSTCMWASLACALRPLLQQRYTKRVQHDALRHCLRVCIGGLYTGVQLQLRACSCDCTWDSLYQQHMLAVTFRRGQECAGACWVWLECQKRNGKVIGMHEHDSCPDGQGHITRQFSDIQSCRPDKAH